jgi:hypothetical protein
MAEADRAQRIVLGVTGHRVLTEIERLTDGVDKALRSLAVESGNREFRILSCLAEGSDRLVAERAIAELGASLSALLPMDRETYMEGFRSHESRRQFVALLDRADEIVELPTAESRVASYEHAGLALVEDSHALVAVWDGQPSQDRGGTGWVVEQARGRGLPMAWVHAGNRAAGTDEPTSLGDDQGRVSYENLDALRALPK